MNIVHVVDSLERGGLERVVTDLAIGQAARGDGVCVFSLNAAGGFIEDLRRAGIKVVCGDKRRSFDLHVLSALRRAARDLRADVVHAHNFVPNYYAATALLGMAGRPVQIGTCHDMGARLADRKLRWMYRWSLRRTAGVAMVGQQVHDRYVGQGFVEAGRAMVVLNGIASSRFAPEAARRAAARAALGVAPHETVLGCVGRLVPLKNHRLLLESVADMLRRDGALRMVLIGHGELAMALRDQATSLGIADKVLFAGEQADVAALLQGLDLFVLPSLTEGLSIALLEACASELPVVATAVGGNVEIVHDEETGLLVPPADGAALGRAISRLLGDRALAARLGRQARAWVAQHASVPTMCDAYESLYRRHAGVRAAGAHAG